MVVVIKRISIVLLLSGMLISGQAEATAASRVQKLGSQVLKVIGSDLALYVTVCSGAVCAIASYLPFDPMVSHLFKDLAEEATKITVVAFTFNTLRLR